MKTIRASQISGMVKDLFIEANLHIPRDISMAIKAAANTESSPVGKEILFTILKNHEIAREKKLPLCQDTGTAVVLVRLGSSVIIQDGTLSEAVNAGVSMAYTENPFRCSIVTDPLGKRINTGNNLPAIMHIESVSGDAMEITVMPKGAGAENMSSVEMIPASTGENGLMKNILGKVEKAGGRPCPPIILGIGIGGNLEYSAILAKKALVRKIGQRNADKKIASLEQLLLSRINDSGIGPMGMGGDTTALEVFIETAPCHMASLPVAVNFNCHLSRHASGEL